MKTGYTSLALILLLVAAADALPQRKTGATRIRPRSLVPVEARSPSYRLYLRIDEGPKLFVSIASPSRQTGEIGIFDLGALITDLPNGGSKSNLPNNVFPKVVIEASPNITMLDFWDPITLFRLDRTEFSVVLPGDTTLTIPPAQQKDPIDVKPNPLLLFVEIDDAGKLSMNGEPTGALSDAKPLQEFLTRILKEREKNGVWHEGTTEVVSDVTIVMPSGPRKFSDLITVANAVKTAGSQRISLAMNSPETIMMMQEAPTGFTPDPPKTKRKP